MRSWVFERVQLWQVRGEPRRRCAIQGLQVDPVASGVGVRGQQPLCDLLCATNNGAEAPIHHLRSDSVGASQGLAALPAPTCIRFYRDER